MSAKEQLNEMKKFRQLMEDIDNDEEGWEVEDFPLAEGGERPYICVHAKKGKHECTADSSYGAAKKAAEAWGLKSTAGIDAHLADVKHSTQFVGEDAGWFDDLGTGEEFARGEDHELTHALLTKVDSALNSIAKGMEHASKHGLAAPMDTKPKVIQLRRQLKEIKAYLESGKKLASIFGKVALANKSADTLADLSYDFDDVQQDVQDAENLLYSHLSKRHVDEDGGDDLGIGMKPADYKRVGQKYVVKRDTYPVEYMHEIDPAYKHNEITTNHNTRKEALAQVKAEVQAYISAFDDPSVTHERGSTVWQGKIPFDDRFGEGAFDQRWSLHEVPVNKWVESISLDSIVESVLEEYPGQPRDYEMSDDEVEAEQEAEFERDTIDKEIEDEELGLRFD